MSCAKPRIRFVGVWDTVSSVGWLENPLHLPYESSNPDIEIGRHAIAIDERRAFFRSHLWLAPKNAASEHGPKDMKQVWFPGVHCDVGGGYPEARSGLSKYALEWMLEEAKAAGLQTIPEKELEVLGRGGNEEYVAASPDATMHESLKGAWRIAEFIPKRHWNWKESRSEHRMNFFRRRTIPLGIVGTRVGVSAERRLCKAASCRRPPRVKSPASRDERASTSRPRRPRPRRARREPFRRQACCGRCWRGRCCGE